MTIQEIPVDKLNPAPYNPRIDLTSEDEAYISIKRSLDEFGCVEPIIWNRKTGHVVGGHQRLKILIENGAKTVQCSVVDLDVTKEKALNIALNKVSGSWDNEKLASLFAEFENAKFEAEITGFSDLEISNLIDDFFNKDVTEDDFEVEKEYDRITETETNPGDIWQIGKHRLACFDATSDLSGLFAENETADMLITDPPYNVDYTGSTTQKLKISNDNLSNEDFYNLLRSSFDNANRWLKCGGAFYIWYAHSESENFLKACRESGLVVHQNLIWCKNAFVLGRQDYHYQHEPCLYGWKPGAAHYFTKKRSLSTVLGAGSIDIDKLSKNELQKLLDGILADESSDALKYDKPMRNKEHPTMKPIELFADLIQNSSRRGEIVLDLFAGSGTTLMACEQAGRIARVVEIDPVYCDVIVHRFRASYPDEKVYKVNK